MNHMHAKLFILIGPSGVGKSTLVQKLAEKKIPFEQLITHTTRQMRPGEIHAKDYFFISNEEFNKKKANNEFIFPVSYSGNQYGTCKLYLESKLQKNCNLICALTGDVAKEMNDIIDGKVVTIFISPPSFTELKTRLLNRKTETDTSLHKRLDAAMAELQTQDSFDYKIINDNLDKATEELKEIFVKETK